MEPVFAAVVEALLPIPPPVVLAPVFREPPTDDERAIGARIFEFNPTLELVLYTIPVPVLGFGRAMPVVEVDAEVDNDKDGDDGLDKTPNSLVDQGDSNGDVGEDPFPCKAELDGVRKDEREPEGERARTDGTGTAGLSPVVPLVNPAWRGSCNGRTTVEDDDAAAAAAEDEAGVVAIDEKALARGNAILVALAPAPPSILACDGILRPPAGKGGKDFSLS